jgi:hypothetical protein
MNARPNKIMLVGGFAVLAKIIVRAVQAFKARAPQGRGAALVACDSVMHHAVCRPSPQP